MSPLTEIELLQGLARLYGVQTFYYDMNGRAQNASPEMLLATLQALEAPVSTMQDTRSALREYRQATWQKVLEPVVVAWENKPLTIKLRLPAHLADGRLSGHLELESGETREWELDGKEIPSRRTASVERTRYVLKELTLPAQLPWGYHRLFLDLPGKSVETFIISAPVKAHPPKGRSWGVFLPLYALHSQKSWGAGDFADLKSLTSWVAGLNGNLVGTLPLLATLFDENSPLSPYAPASRLFWNEFYIDIVNVPELQKSPSAQALLASTQFQREVQELRSLAQVDYHRQMSLKKRLLEELCWCFFDDASGRLRELQRFVELHPAVEDYARFRAACDQKQASWWTWPQPQKDGLLVEGDYHEKVKRYYLYTQWTAYGQFREFSTKSREKGMWLYLDLPLGVHPDGYDAWREQKAFALEVSAGAPPDPVFTKGQSWGFPPLHPEKIRKQGYRYFIAYLRHHLRYAQMLRIDHVMGLHRLFWIPKGFEASQGVYVRYHPDEFYAILTLESQRNRSVIVGEDLGMVPPAVRPAMARHGLQRMYILHFEMASNQQAIRPPVTNCVASLNTHDMFPFAATWQNLDIPERLRLSQLMEDGAHWEYNHRRTVREAVINYLQKEGLLSPDARDVGTILRAVLAFLASSRARIVLVNLEDLWLETQPQNIPGTYKEYPNWQHKALYDLETLCQMPEVIDTLKNIDALRKRRHAGYGK